MRNFAQYVNLVKTLIYTGYRPVSSYDIKFGVGYLKLRID